MFAYWLSEGPSPCHSPCQSKQRRNTSSAPCAGEPPGSEPTQSLFTISNTIKKILRSQDSQRLTLSNTLLSGSFIPPLFISPWLFHSTLQEEEEEPPVLPPDGIGADIS